MMEDANKMVNNWVYWKVPQTMLVIQMETHSVHLWRLAQSMELHSGLQGWCMRPSMEGKEYTTWVYLVFFRMG
jgi:hypothetical protein